MRLFIPDLAAKSGGPGSFFRCLVPALGPLGVETRSGLGLGADVVLVSPFCHAPMLHWIRARRLPIVQRLDGIHYGPARRFNDLVRRVYDVADTVVFQSEFSRRIFLHQFGEPPAASCVIKNGTDLSVFYPSHESAPKGPVRLIASSFWRPQKRLRDCLEISTAFRRVVPDATLTVLGDTSRVPSEARAVPGVIYSGVLGRDAVAARLRESDLFLHPSWFDPCPNAVVEALASGLPVLHTKNGGTRELVPSGCGVELLREPDFDLAETDVQNYARIPRVHPDEAVNAILAIMDNYSRYRRHVAENRASFGIERTAQQYQQVFAACGQSPLASGQRRQSR